MDAFYILTSETTKKTDLCIFCQKVKKSENFSSSSTGRKKLIDLSNKLQDKLQKGITDLGVIQYHSNEYYKPSTLQPQRELENRIRKEHRTEKNEAEGSVLVKQERLSKRQKANDSRSNESIICRNKTFRKDRKLYRLCEAEKAELFLRATKFNTDAAFTKESIFDKPDDLSAVDIMSHR